MLKVGLVGVGHLGKIHLGLLQKIPDFEVVGVYDSNPEVLKEVSAQFSIKAFSSYEELMDACQVIDVVTPTVEHFSCATAAVKKGKHVFIEKPLCQNIKEAKLLMQLVDEGNITLQVGHVERFNPAFLALKNQIKNPMFIESHRLAQFNPRGTDVSVVLDLMIHDIDIVLSIINSGIKRISASGVSVISESPDICNARIEFANGCVANLTASRISLKNMRKTRIFQKDAYISVDFLEKKSDIVRIKEVEGMRNPMAMIVEIGEGKPAKEIFFERPPIKDINAIEEELKSFADCILNGKKPEVGIGDGYYALEVAYQIIEKMQVAAGVLDV